MDCAIWLNRTKIFSADEIPANFDIAAIRGYFLGGSLIKWLAANGGQAYIGALKALSPSDPALNDKLTEIFTKKKCTVPTHCADEGLIRTVDKMRGAPAPVKAVGSGSYGAASFNFGRLGGFDSYRFGFAEYGSFSLGSFNFGSFNYGSFGKGSFNYGSYYLGSFARRTWQWEWEWRYGSFRGGSYRGIGSYSLKYGSFSGGSYRLGSFNSGAFGSFGYGFGSYRFGLGFDTGSYKGFPLGGSLRTITSDEYDEIMYRCLNMCPLNRFGYGIHLI